MIRLVGAWLLAMLPLAPGSPTDPGEPLSQRQVDCKRGDDWACREIVDMFTRDRVDSAASRDAASQALATLDGLCRVGTARACYLLADFMGHGVEGVLPVDLARARLLTEDACRKGWTISCGLAELLRTAPPTQNTVDVAREALVRHFLERSTSDASRDSNPIPLCLAVAPEGDLEGADAPADFIGRFDRMPTIQPCSWCRDNEEGSILVLGPVTQSPWPPTPGLVVHYAFYPWAGNPWSGSSRLVERDGAWVLSGGMAQRPIVVADDRRAADRERIVAQLAPFVAAWNRGEPEVAVGSLPASRPRPPTGLQYREHTRLEAVPTSIEFGPPDWPFKYARVSLRLHGTFQPRPGLAWPLEPWKQAGAVSSIVLQFTRTGGWWRAGRWTPHLELMEAPWAVTRIAH